MRNDEMRFNSKQEVSFGTVLVHFYKNNKRRIPANGLAPISPPLCTFFTYLPKGGFTLICYNSPGSIPNGLIPFPLTPLGPWGLPPLISPWDYL